MQLLETVNEKAVSAVAQLSVTSRIFSPYFPLLLRYNSTGSFD